MKEPYDFHNPNLLGVAEQIKRLRPLRQVMGPVAVQLLTIMRRAPLSRSSSSVSRTPG